ncbi:MAG: YadA-like family protein [Alphaproteobacteria bacterium]|nr:YadA-like family protein [Alphaproteobacteria bacterium]
MKKHIMLTSLVAIGVLTNVNTASAAVESNLGDIITNLSLSEEAKAGAVDLANYSFTNPDGSETTLAAIEGDYDDYGSVYDDYVATSAANGTTVQLNGVDLNIAQGTVAAANYQYMYTNAAGESGWRNGDSAPVTLSKDVELSFDTVNIAANMTEIANDYIDMGNADDGWTYAEGEWHLTRTANGTLQLNGSDATTEAEQTAFSELSARYNADMAALNSTLDDLHEYQASNEDNYALIEGIVDADNESIANIAANQATYAAQVAQYNLDNAGYVGYQGSVAQAIDNSIASVNGTIHGLISTESAANNETTNGRAYNGNLAIGTTVEDHLLALDSAIGNRATLHGEHVQAGADVVTNLQTLNDGIEAETRARIASDAALSKKVNSLTSKIDDVEKDMSAGVASAVALSSVAVSDVKKGEASVGGGYGYYNGESAIAFGAAMGLTNNWSVNAGAGMGTSGSNVSFRAGTNYKFKLF